MYVPWGMAHPVFLKCVHMLLCKAAIEIEEMVLQYRDGREIRYSAHLKANLPNSHSLKQCAKRNIAIPQCLHLSEFCNFPAK